MEGMAMGTGTAAATATGAWADCIEYRGREYPLAHVEIEGYGLRPVSTEALEEALMPDGGGYADGAARAIDVGIFFYAPESAMEAGAEAVKRAAEEGLGIRPAMAVAGMAAAAAEGGK